MINYLNNCPVRPVPGPGGRALSLLGGALLLAQTVLAATPTPYGEYFVRLDETTQASAGRALPAPGPAAAADRADYEGRLVVLEQAGGPYADTLAEPLADLARLHRANGDVELARQAYLRALHVIRINDGLYSERQVPILRELLASYRATRDMAALDGRYDYFFRLYGSGQPPYTPLRLGAALEYLRWQREALRLGLDEQDAQRMLKLYSLNQSLLEGVADDPAVEFASYRALALSQLQNLYLIQQRFKPTIETGGAGAQPGVSGAAGVTGAAGTFDGNSANQRRLETVQHNILARGRDLLAGLINRTPPGQVDDLAGAWLELADWNQWNDRRADALAAYDSMITLLREADRVDLMDDWLGQPVELPANGVFWQPRQGTEAANPVVVQAHYDVSATGKASNIEVTAVDSEYEGKAIRVQRNLGQTRFRPRFVNGEPEAQTQLERDYEVLN